MNAQMGVMVTVQLTWGQWLKTLVRGSVEVPIQVDTLRRIVADLDRVQAAVAPPQ